MSLLHEGVSITAGWSCEMIGATKEQKLESTKRKQSFEARWVPERMIHMAERSDVIGADSSSVRGPSSPCRVRAQISERSPSIAVRPSGRHLVPPSSIILFWPILFYPH